MTRESDAKGEIEGTILDKEAAWRAEVEPVWNALSELCKKHGIPIAAHAVYQIGEDEDGDGAQAASMMCHPCGKVAEADDWTKAVFLALNRNWQALGKLCVLKMMEG